MGACASKPKEFGNSPAEAPVKPETETAQEETTMEVENQKESPLVDLSEQKKEDDEVLISKSTEVAEAETTTAEEEVTEKKVEAAIIESPSEKAAVKSDEPPLVTV